ncbi:MULTISPECIES: SDR family oxidoreductase [Rhizobium]|uniref:SDR family oxidoreductase n=1 Tax=Rhizobium rhododendri TaxID=2506430 RepID=A0ABY8IJ48_9HYPH|nr:MULTISPECIES: SDR family oxidoreductase [Rhizobium]MBZ5760131.1 SDR family oxidoreductase [Rhizobium sp. VS19-DR96]MBZ5766388.1 SDR family oxidoreductase [Rhizobium sp. VS19-DR129.2]MBZ5774269.1 SDR family oxidoreductase [Rhizobium sp. VS19-DRK62.2]MBZ5785341.1 SDR family oxidoreductase [Rhizobium sp. VS19-DR121]MBZ5802940.1 SDR family oxidoreductase [Rhizobium sp. VS19-DR181]
MTDNKLRTALITGASRRIGSAMARDLASNGFNIAIHADTSMVEAEALAAELRLDGIKAIAVKADLQNNFEVSTLVERTVSALGPLDLLINNASTFRSDTADAFDAEAFEAHFAVHVRAPSILAAEFARQLPDSVPGLIVNIIDQRVWALNPRFYSYTLSKAALWTATQTLAQSFAPRIRVNAIGPGPTLASSRQAPEDFQAQIDGLLLKAGPGLDEFGRTVRFLFDTPSITGQMIALDGGQHLAWETPDVPETAE